MNTETTGSVLIVVGLVSLLVPDPLLAAARAVDRAPTATGSPGSKPVRLVRLLGLATIATGTILSAADDTSSVPTERT